MNPSIEETGKADACTTGISNIITGIFAYLFLAVAVLAFTIAGAMNLGTSHGIAIAVALVITGLYIIEKTAGLDGQHRSSCCRLNQTQGVPTRIQHRKSLPGQSQYLPAACS